MPHFFINSKNIKGSKILLDDKENYNHIVKSLRSKIGENLLLIDENQIQYETKIEEISKNSILTKIIKQYKSTRQLPFNLFLAQSPLKNDSQNLIVEKATELGISGLYPIFTDNCVLKKTVILQKIPKWQKIMYEASKQCERANIPTCFDLTNLEKLINTENFDRILAFCEREANTTLKAYLAINSIKPKEKILLIIGPEGGFTKNEFSFFEENNIVKLSLGNLILKAETAVIAALGNIVL